MWIMKHRRIISKESEKCRGIDDDRLDNRHDRDLDLEPEDFDEDDDLELEELLGLSEDEYEEEDTLEHEMQWEIERSSAQVPLGL